jgi:hypothetical protein
VHLVLPDLHPADECGGAELAGAETATPDQQGRDDGPDSDAAGCTPAGASGTQDASHGRYFLTLRASLSK